MFQKLFTLLTLLPLLLFILAPSANAYDPAGSRECTKCLMKEFVTVLRQMPWVKRRQMLCSRTGIDNYGAYLFKRIERTNDQNFIRCGTSCVKALGYGATIMKDMAQMTPNFQNRIHEQFAELFEMTFNHAFKLIFTTGNVRRGFEAMPTIREEAGYHTELRRRLLASMNETVPAAERSAYAYAVEETMKSIQRYGADPNEKHLFAVCDATSVTLIEEGPALGCYRNGSFIRAPDLDSGMKCTNDYLISEMKKVAKTSKTMDEFMATRLSIGKIPSPIIAILGFAPELKRLVLTAPEMYHIQAASRRGENISVNEMFFKKLKESAK